MNYRLGFLCAIASIACLNLLATTASAGVITSTTLGTYTNPFVFDFQSPAEGNISGTDGYFTANGISSVTAVSGVNDDIYDNFPPANTGLFHNQSTGLLIDNQDGVARTFHTDTVFTFNLSESQHRFGFEILDQLNSDMQISFFDGVTAVGSTTFSYPTSGVINYFHNTDAFNRVVIEDLVNGGYGLDNITIETVSAVPEPATMTLWALGSLGCAIGAYRRKRSK